MPTWREKKHLKCKKKKKKKKVYRFGTHEVFFSKMSYIHVVWFCKQVRDSQLTSQMWYFCISDGGYLILETKYLHVHVGIGWIMLVGELEEMLQQPICRSLFWFGSHLGMHQCEIVPLIIILKVKNVF